MCRTYIHACMQRHYPTFYQESFEEFSKRVSVLGLPPPSLPCKLTLPRCPHILSRLTRSVCARSISATFGGSLLGIFIIITDTARTTPAAAVASTSTKNRIKKGASDLHGSQYIMIGLDSASLLFLPSEQIFRACFFSLSTTTTTRARESKHCKKDGEREREN